MNRPRVLLADDHAIFIEGLRRVLAPVCDEITSVGHGRAMVDAVERERPDVVVTDVSMPEMNGIDAARLLRDRSPRTKVIFLSMHDDLELAMEAFRVGAMGYLVKTTAGDELTTAIRSVIDGKVYVSYCIAKGDTLAFERARRQPERGGKPLTPREREVLQLVASGNSLKEIAGKLNVAIRTVVFHKANIMEKLGLRTTAELTRYAIRHRLVPDC